MSSRGDTLFYSFFSILASHCCPCVIKCALALSREKSLNSSELPIHTKPFERTSAKAALNSPLDVCVSLLRIQARLCVTLIMKNTCDVTICNFSSAKRGRTESSVFKCTDNRDGFMSTLANIQKGTLRTRPLPASGLLLF